MRPIFIIGAPPIKNLWSTKLCKLVGGSLLYRNGPSTDLCGGLVINWGRSIIPQFVRNHPENFEFLNPPWIIQHCLNKINCLQLLNCGNIPTLSWTVYPEVAQEWNKTNRIFVRHKIKSFSGKGIEILEPNSELPIAPLYTKDWQKDLEFRVHVFNNTVIDYAQKKKMSSAKLVERGITKVDMDVRSWKRGWIFARNNIYHGPEIEQLAIDAVKALSMNFGAVDIFMKGDEKIVCEINSAPALRGITTMNSYINTIQTYAEESV